MVDELNKKENKTDGEQKIAEDLFDAFRYIEILEAQVIALQTLKVDINFSDQELIKIEESRRLYNLEKYYVDRATSNATLKHAIAELITFGITNSDGEPSEQAKEFSEIIRGQIRTRNYIIQKCRGSEMKEVAPDAIVGPQEAEMVEESNNVFRTDKVQSQGLIITHILTKQSFRF